MRTVEAVHLFIVLSLCLSSAQSSTKGSSPLESMSALAEKRVVPSLDTREFRKIISSSERNFPVLVVFTALSPEHGCESCLEFNREVHRFASAVRKQRSSFPKPLFVVNVDIDNAREIFEEYELEYAPIVNMFKPKEKQSSKLSYDPANNFDVHGTEMTAEELATFTYRMIRYKVNLVAKGDEEMIMYYAAAGFLCCAILSLLYRSISGSGGFRKLYQSWKLWYFVAMVWMFFCLAGTAFNLIRKPSWYNVDPRTRRPTIFASGQSNQTILEGALISGVSILFSKETKQSCMVIVFFDLQDFCFCLF
eukprot:TRINITY_DN4743_c0_g1_i1.p1 TRINITY_DN4743_c0_g1~~TRINITY_DN4743_c0_g1_i1.p1  ORF type:complete len:307 (-),score=52.18 TRINITY_DN4743_c0_g1_i1:29-949(-)